MKRYITLFFFITSFLLSHADTIRMMQYNLMYYTNESGVSDCNSSTNNLDNKDVNLRTIFNYAQPDVICVNEIGNNSIYADRILDNVLNTDGVGYFRRCPLTNYSGGYIANMLFYDSRRLTFHSHFYITSAYRDINAYKMYYNSEELAQGDTVFMTFMIAHLKAGGYESNQEQRYVQAQRIMARIEQIGTASNYIFSGDFNLVGASEQAYQYFINYPNSLFRFYDPINAEGEWNNNSNYAYLHTQSTHTQSNGCFVTGGMDDRFDIILVSPYIYYGSKGVKSINSTYHALGQDGHRFNGSIISPSNNSEIPYNIATALYNQSDHLPVMLDFEVNATAAQIDRNQPTFMVKVVNPVQDRLTIMLHSDVNDHYLFEVYSIQGILLKSVQKEIVTGSNTFVMNFDYPSALYVIKITDSKGFSIVKKIIK